MAFFLVTFFISLTFVIFILYLIAKILGGKFWYFFKSFLGSFREALNINPDVRKFIERYPRLSDFVYQRLRRNRFFGLPLTLFSLAFLYVALLFFGVINDLLTSNVLAAADLRIENLFYAWRTLPAVKVFLWLTFLGEKSMIVVFALMISGILWLLKKNWQILIMWFIIAGSALSVWLTKMFFDRPRPINAVYLETSASFPSAHATLAVVFCGFVVFLLLSYLKKKKYKLLSLLSGLAVILVIGFSRIYLGVHYFSDVWAGYLLGLLWLIIGMALTQWKTFKTLIITKKEPLTTRKKSLIALIIVLAFGIYFISAWRYRPTLYLTSTVMPEDLLATDVVNVFDEHDIPKYTETLFGNPQEPLSFIVIAKNDEVFLNAFRQSGWTLADGLNLKNAAEMLQTAVMNKQYLTAPVTPSFWNSSVHNFGFQKATDLQTVRQRHHARFWKTDIKTKKGDSIYVGSASLDTGLKWFVTHRIDPVIDNERNVLFTDLSQNNHLKLTELIQFVPPVLGKNFTGDQFFSDGQAYVIKF